jgi:RNA 2',3'-cyclic 3'-phosphodiesterase
MTPENEYLRLFVGLPLPPSYQEVLGRLQTKWRPLLRSRVSWTRVGNWHLTIQFLGNVPNPSVESVKAALGRVKFPAFFFRAGGGGFFPSLQRPRVAWIGITNGREQCIELAGAVASALKPLGFAPDRETLSPHLTIARIREDLRDPWKTLKNDLETLDFPGCTIGRFILWKSDLSPKGPIYTPAGEYPLISECV